MKKCHTRCLAAPTQLHAQSFPLLALMNPISEQMLDPTSTKKNEFWLTAALQALHPVKSQRAS